MKFWGLWRAKTNVIIDRLFVELKKHLQGGGLLFEVLILIVDKHVGMDAPHYDEYFVAEKMKDEEYVWIADVPLCLEGSYVFLYDKK